MEKNSKIFGVVEGFYGKTYSFYERCDLIKFLSSLKLNTYVYGPKSDPFHRKEYYKLYPAVQMKEFETLNNLARKHGIKFNYALSPGPRPNIGLIIKKVKSMMKIGIENYSIFYDDLEIKLDSNTALKQTTTANKVYELIKEKFKNPDLFFCPTQYRSFEKTEYILTVAKTLHKNIKIFWTGKNIVSRKITEKDIDLITEILGRAPLIWDNIFANDYIPGIIIRFPYRNREPGIIKKVCGILLNPMNQYLKSKPLIYNASEFFKNPYNYNPRNFKIKSINFYRQKIPE